jgi:hypothetical protein
MKANAKPAYFVVLRPIGAALLLTAYPLSAYAVAVGKGHAGHEPAIIYALSLLIFVCVSAGAALTIHGRHLFGRIAVSDQWVSRAPPIATMSRPSDPSPEAGEVSRSTS